MNTKTNNITNQYNTFEEYAHSGACHPVCDEIKTAEIYNKWERDILDVIQETGYYRRLAGLISVEDFDFSSLREIKATRLETALLILMSPEQRREKLKDYQEGF